MPTLDIGGHHNYARDKCYPFVIRHKMPASCLKVGDILPNGLKKKKKILFFFRQNVSQIEKPD